MRSRRIAQALQVDDARGLVEGGHAAAVTALALVGFRGGGVLRRVADLHLVGLLGEPVAVDDRALLLRHFTDVGQRPERRPALDVLLFREAATGEELPPRGLLLAPVELQQVRQQPPRPSVVGRRRVVGRRAAGERLEQGRDPGRRLPLPFALVVPRGRPRRRFARPRLELTPALLQPVGETQRRKAVVPVVSFDFAAQFVRRPARDARLQRRLEPDERPRRRRQPDRAPETVERLQLLDGIALDRGPQPLPHHAVQVDEHVAAEQTVHLLPAGGVPARQALDRGRLVGAVVVDVEAGMPRPARHDPVDEALERALLVRRVERPAGVVPAGPVRHPEQVLQTAVPREGVAFDVEEYVAGRRRRQRREPLAPLDRRDELADAPALAPRPILHARLLADAGQRGGADPVQPGDQRQVERAQIGHRRDAARHEPAPLAAGDAGDQRQMIVGPAPFRARLLPRAERAMLDRFRIRLRRRVGVGLETPAHRAVVRRVLHDPEALEARAVAPAEDKAHPPGFASLGSRQQVRVQEKLQQRLALCAAGQLRVEHLVRPAAQRAAPVHAEQEVGIAAPAPGVVLQTPLVDDVDPARHRVARARRRRRRVPPRQRRVRFDDRLHHAAFGPEPLHEPPLVLHAALPQHVAAGIVVRRRRLDLAERDGPVESRQVAAREVAGEIGGRERKPAGGAPHGIGR